MKEILIHEKVFNNKVVVLHGTYEEARERFTELYLSDSLNPKAQGTVNIHPSKVTGYFYLWLLKDSEEGEVFVLSHEAVHLASILFQYKNFPIDVQSGEMFCYYTGWWFKSIVKALKLKV